MVVTSVWAMFAVCVVLFVRGASPHVHRSDDASGRDELAASDVPRSEA
jgi:hypothetical protein